MKNLEILRVRADEEEDSSKGSTGVKTVVEIDAWTTKGRIWPRMKEWTLEWGKPEGGREMRLGEAAGWERLGQQGLSIRLGFGRQNEAMDQST